MRWHYEDIDYESIDREKIRRNDLLFKTIAIASFIEITSDIYDKNLSEYYRGDTELVQWLNKTWEPEEVQHGKSLKKYVNTVWPDFDWDSAYKDFQAAYLPLCRVEFLQETKAKEMLARMVVETGTSTFYKAIESYANDLGEPILLALAHYISKDEVYHFEMFEKAFKKFRKDEKLSRIDIVKILYSRLEEVNSEDVKLAYEALHTGENYDAYLHEMKEMAKKYYPYTMAIKMFMRPLDMNRMTENIVAKTLQPAFKYLGI